MGALAPFFIMNSPTKQKEATQRIRAIGPVVIFRHVLFRRNLDESQEYLVDFWKGKAVFDRDPTKSQVTGYSWMAVADAEFTRDRIKLEAGIDLYVASILFRREKDGTWAMSRLA